QAKPLGQIVDGDLAPLVDPLVERVAVVDEQLGDLHVEVAREVGAVGEPALRLLGEAVDGDQRRGTLVFAAPAEVKEFADIGFHRPRGLPGVAGGGLGWAGVPRATRPRRRRPWSLTIPRAPAHSNESPHEFFVKAGRVLGPTTTRGRWRTA